MAARLWSSIKRESLVFVLALALLVISPFNLDKATTFATEELFFNVAAFAYPNQASPSIALIKADDDTLAAARPNASGRSRLPTSWNRWPLPLHAWAEAIRHAQSQGATHILLDVAILEDKPEAETLALARAMIEATSTAHIYLVASPRVSSGVSPALAAQIAGHPGIHLVSARGGVDDGPSAAYAGIGAEPYRPAAVLVAENYCRQTGRCPNVARSGVTEDAFLVWWKAPPISADCDRAAAKDLVALGCRAVPGHWMFRFLQLTWAGLSEGLCDKAAPDRRGAPCRIGGARYYGALPFEVRRLEDVAGIATPRTPEPRQTAEIVVIGGTFDFAEDLAHTPIYAGAPGAALHAMAIDNLIALDGRVFTRRLPLGLSGFAFDLACLSVACLAVALTGGLITSRWSPGPLTMFVVEGAAVFALALAASGLAFVTRTSPANWVGILLTVSTLSTALRLRGSRHA